MACGSGLFIFASLQSIPLLVSDNQCSVGLADSAAALTSSILLWQAEYDYYK